MNGYRIHRYVAGRLLWLALAALLTRPLGAVGMAEETFDVLKIGSRMYTNVTVMTKARTYVFIVHTGGMTSLKVADLPPALQEKLGYAAGGSLQGPTNTAIALAKKQLARLDTPQIKNFRKQLGEKWRGPSAAKLSAMGLLGPKLNWTRLGIVLLVGLSLYVFYSYCCMLICRKAGHPPGVLVWLPFFKLFPMFRAAGMSYWWLLAFLVPVVNLVPLILWPFKIAKARGKSVWVGVLLLLPVTNLFALLYLAFSNGALDEQDEGPEPKVICFQTV